MLRYQSEIDELPCAMNGFEEWSGDCFRWTFDTIEDERNFSPVYKMDPQRLGSDIKRNKANCNGWALSFFATQESAKDRIKHITKDKQQLYMKLGTHTAKGNLCLEDGIRDETDGEGHFNHFEYCERDLALKFAIVEVLHP